MVTTQKENATNTKAEIKAGKQCLVEKRQRAKEERQAGNECITGIQNRQALEDIKAKIAAKPRPQPRQVRPASKGQPSMHLDQMDGSPTNDSMEANISAGVPEIVDVGGKATLKTTASSSAPKPPPSHSSTRLSAEDEPPAVLLDDDDAVECKAAHLLMNLHKSPAADWQISQSKDKDIDYGQPPFTQKPTIAPMSVKAEPMDIPVDVTNDFSGSNDDLIIQRSSCQKWTTTIVQAANHGDMPSSKCP
ncbi:hypothetical protein BS17DRAFT_768531 [Gyrodon lividus]|nr:hypothetical protein BS17DRAFT_768531 [Gyrodon lividus]